MQPRKLVLAVMLSPILLHGCGKTVVPDASIFCEAVRPVCVAPGDVLTKPTASRLVKNEYGRAAVCGVPKKCEPEKAEPPKVASAKQ